MSRQASHDGFALNLSVSDKQALLAQTADDAELLDSPLFEFAQMVGPEAIDQLCQIYSGEKIHIPTPKNFWSRLNRHLHHTEMVKTVCHLIDQHNFTMASAITQVADQYGVSFGWLKTTYLGGRDDG